MFLQFVVQNDEKYIVCHHDDSNYKFKSHAVILLLDSMTDKSGKKYVLISQLISSYFEKFGEALNDSLIESMNHFIDVQNEDNIQVVSLSKLAAFLLSIVNILKSAQSVTVADLKSKISSNACFEVGNNFLIEFLE